MEKNYTYIHYHSPGNQENVSDSNHLTSSDTVLRSPFPSRGLWVDMMQFLYNLDFYWWMRTCQDLLHILEPLES